MSLIVITMKLILFFSFPSPFPIMNYPYLSSSYILLPPFKKYQYSPFFPYAQDTGEHFLNPFKHIPVLVTQESVLLCLGHKKTSQPESQPR